MSANSGINKHGEAEISAIIKEFKQIIEGAVPGKHAVITADEASLIENEKKKDLSVINLIKEKWRGKIKGRSFVGDSKQRTHLKQEEYVASSTAYLESLFAALLIDAYEGRDIATHDTPGSYLHAKLTPRESNERILMKLRGSFIDIMCSMIPEQSKNMIHENGKIFFICRF